MNVPVSDCLVNQVIKTAYAVATPALAGLPQGEDAEHFEIGRTLQAFDREVFGGVSHIDVPAKTVTSSWKSLSQARDELDRRGAVTKRTARKVRTDALRLARSTGDVSGYAAFTRLERAN